MEEESGYTISDYIRALKLIRTYGDEVEIVGSLEIHVGDIEWEDGHVEELESLGCIIEDGIITV